MLADMTIQRMDNVAIVVDDLDAAVAFFTELGMELEGKGQIEGLWADRTVGLDGVRSEIAMMRTPDGHSKLELTRYHAPLAMCRLFDLASRYADHPDFPRLVCGSANREQCACRCGTSGPSRRLEIIYGTALSRVHGCRLTTRP